MVDCVLKDIDPKTLDAWSATPFDLCGIPQNRRRAIRTFAVALCAKLGFSTPDLVVHTDNLPSRIRVRVALCDLFETAGWLPEPDSCTHSRLRRRVLQHLRVAFSNHFPTLTPLLPVHLLQCRDPIQRHMSRCIVIEDAISGYLKRGLCASDAWLLEWTAQMLEKVASVSRWTSQTTATTWGHVFCHYVRASGILCGLVCARPGEVPPPSGVWFCEGHQKKTHHIWVDDATLHDGGDRLTQRLRSMNTEDQIIAHTRHVLCNMTVDSSHGRTRYVRMIRTLFSKVLRVFSHEQLSLILRHTGTKCVRRSPQIHERDNLVSNMEDTGFCRDDVDCMATTRKSQRITDSEMRAMLTSETSAKHRCILYILFSTGVRRGALCRIRVIDIMDPATNVIRPVLHAFEKNKRRTAVPLTEEVQTVIREWLRVRPSTHSPYLFPSMKYESGHISRTNLDHYFKAHALKNGVSRDRAHVHATRHTAAMRLIESNHTPDHVQQLLGHDSIETTHCYIRLEEQHLSRIHVPSLMGSDSCKAHAEWQSALRKALQ